MPSPLLVRFVGGASGRWRVERVAPVRGDRLADVPRVDMLEGDSAGVEGSPVWVLRGVTAWYA